jgi:TatD DNase family protein
MLVETDAPFLTPMPYRGRPNAPYLVPLTVRAIAAIKQVSVETVARGLAETAAQVFGW